MKKLLFLSLSLLFISCSSITPIPKKKKDTTHNVSSDYLKKFNFGDKELIAEKIDDEYYYLHKNGKKIKTITVDGEADKFADGLARTKVKGKIGFFNKNLEIVLKPVYDFAFPFYHGEAEICTGCKEKELEDGTMMLDGGTWKKIDRSGLIIE